MEVRSGENASWEERNPTLSFSIRLPSFTRRKSATTFWPPAAAVPAGIGLPLSSRSWYASPPPVFTVASA
jgi:hypothetical protein